jgi:hypothetical protein
LYSSFSLLATYYRQIAYEIQAGHFKFDQLFEQKDKPSFMNTDEYLKMIGKEEGREEGILEGQEKAAEALVKNLLEGSDFAVEKIASLANVTVEFVDKIKNNLNGAR